jgi:hypothetical protein
LYLHYSYSLRRKIKTVPFGTVAEKKEGRKGRKELKEGIEEG